MADVFADDSSNDELSITAVINTIESVEHEAETVRFECRTKWGLFAKHNGRWQFERGSGTDADLAASETVQLDAAATVLVNPRLGNYRIQQRQLLKVEDEGTSQQDRTRFTFLIDDFSSDGEICRLQHRGSISRVRPVQDVMEENWENSSELPGEATNGFSSEESAYHQNSSLMALRGYHIGLGHVVPYVSPIIEVPQRLSELLRVKHSGGDYIAARVLPDGTWEIFYSIEKTFSTSYAFRVFYDPSAGRVIRTEQGGCETCTRYDWDDWKISYLTLFDYENEAARLPTTVTYLNLTGPAVAAGGKQLRKGIQWKYSQQAINPDTAAGDYRFDFAPGVLVNDFLEKSTYVAGAGLERDQASVIRFLAHNGLTDPGTPTNTNAGGSSFLILGVNLMLASIAALAWYVRSRKRTLIILAILANYGAPLPNQQAVADPNYVRECGHAVTMAVLELRGVNYTLETLRNEMPATSAGVSLGQIARFLTAHGLHVEARKSVGVSDLSTACKQGFIAIVPIILADGRGHYVVAMNGPDGVAVVDVLRSVYPLGEGLHDSDLAALGGYTLLVGVGVASSGRSPAQCCVEFEDKLVDLGLISVDGEDKYTPVTCATVLRNLSDMPVVVESVAGGCGCVKPRWKSRIIDAKATIDLHIDISRTGWGKGPSRRSVVLKLRDGTSTSLAVVGEGVPEAALAQQIRLSRSSISFSCRDSMDAIGNDNTLPAESIDVTGDEEDLKSLKFESTSQWIVYSLTDASEGTRRVSVGVSFDDEVRSELRRVRAISGVLRFFTNANQPPVTCHVHLARSSLFRFEPRSAEMDSNSDTLTFRLFPADGRVSEAVQIKAVSCIPEGGLSIDAASSAELNGTLGQLELRRLDTTQRRGYVIRAVVHFGDGEDEVYGTVIVR